MNRIVFSFSGLEPLHNHFGEMMPSGLLCLARESRGSAWFMVEDPTNKEEVEEKKEFLEQKLCSLGWLGVEIRQGFIGSLDYPPTE